MTNSRYAKDDVVRLISSRLTFCGIRVPNIEAAAKQHRITIVVLTDVKNDPTSEKAESRPDMPALVQLVSAIHKLRSRAVQRGAGCLRR